MKKSLKSNTVYATKMNFYQVLFTIVWRRSENKIVPKARTQDVLETARLIYESDPRDLDDYFWWGNIYMINAVRDRFNGYVPDKAIGEEELNSLYWELGKLELPDVIIEEDDSWS